MATNVVVLVLETDESEGDPADWDWNTLVDTPGSVYVAGAAKIKADPEPNEVDGFSGITDIFIKSVANFIGE